MSRNKQRESEYMKEQKAAMSGRMPVPRPEGACEAINLGAQTQTGIALRQPAAGRRNASFRHLWVWREEGAFFKRKWLLRKYQLHRHSK
jgi:hypothetical protein